MSEVVEVAVRRRKLFQSVEAALAFCAFAKPQEFHVSVLSNGKCELTYEETEGGELSDRD